MTSLSSPSRSVLSSIALISSRLLMAVIPLVLLASCADKHIGRRCEIGLPPDPNIAGVNPQALECPSRICLLPTQSVSPPTGTAPTGALCTDFCTGDDDCADGEKRSDLNPNGCINGFTCRTPIGKVMSPISCKRVCVCKDFFTSEEIRRPPPPPIGCSM